MTHRSLQDTLKISGLSLPNVYPRDLTSIVPLQMPLAFVSIKGLATNILEQWLTSRQIPYRVEGPRRRLHGALAARAGHGVVFIDGTDDIAEQRFTAAHETAHFIQDHLAPRLKALRVFGETIRPVLDGKRPPTPEESVSAVLNRVPLGVQVHLMSRGPNGSICGWDIEEREQRADRLALEMLAPASAVLRKLRHTEFPNAMGEANETALALSQHFGLPMSAARAYVTLLLDKGRSRPKLSEILLGGNQ